MSQGVLSPLQTQKFTALFSQMDIDHDGTLTAADFQAQAGRIADALGWAGDARKERELLQNRQELFARLLSGADKDASGSVTLPEFLKYFERQILAYRAAKVVSPWLVESCRGLFNLIDADASGFINAEEYAKLLFAMGSDADAAAAFAKVDRDRDGKLLLADLLTLSVEFMMSDDPDAAGNFFFCGKM